MVSATVVLQNLAYLIGAVVLAIVLGVAVALRHRRPRSMEANVESFNRGLRALSPDGIPRKRRRKGPPPVGSAAPSRTAIPLGRDVRAHQPTEAETG
ncbi:MAG TPA: hypothetical protein VKV25_02880 [Acidimicrobiales bacterium]|nr:hypothetical protein [Acidimicrobiales bacterium]